MPYKSKRQAAFIHAAAKRGSKWAKDFVKHSKGSKVQKRKRVKRAAKKRTKG